MTYSKAEQHDEAEALRLIFARDPRTFLVLKHVSRSGMLRKITVLVPDDENGIVDISWRVARALDWRYDDGVVVRGVGMDMGFHLIYSLGQKLYGAANGSRLSDSQVWL